MLLIANQKSRASSGWAAWEADISEREDIEIYPLGPNLDDVVRRAVDAGTRTVIAAGGDGTISSVANTILRLGLDVRLGVLPAGTFNHFAKDVGIPTDHAEALRVIDAGHTRSVDVGAVNDLYFVNNSSLGFYPTMVNTRQAMERSGVSKWRAFAQVLLHTGLTRSAFSLRLGSEGTTAKKTAGVFIGNNRYALEGFQLGARARLDEGTLFVALFRDSGLLALFRLVIKALRGRVLSDDALDVIGLTECVVDSGRRTLLVAHDGEVTRLAPPLRYRTVPQALRVIVPQS